MLKIKKDRMIEKIICNIPNNAKIADFGCGTGYFLNQLKSRSNEYALYGFDIKPHCHSENFIYQTMNLDGLFTGVESNQFDMAISQHTMEHLKDPLTYFSEMVRTLKVGGYLFVETPSDRSTWFSYPFHQELNVILSYYDDPTHIGRPWSPQSLYRLGCYHNLKVICSEYDSDWQKKITLPFNFVKFLTTKNTDKFVDDYWRALGWCSYAIFKKTSQSTNIMDYYSFKGHPHGQMGEF